MRAVMVMKCCVADAGSPLWSTATVSQQHSANNDSFSSPLAPALTLDSPSVVTLLPRNAAAGSTPCLPLDGAAVGARSFANSIASVAGDVTSLYQTRSQQQQVDFRSAYGSVTTCFRFATKSSGPDFYRLRRLLRRAKRQAAAADGGREDADVDVKGNDDDDGCISRYPLYCIVCRVHLNAQLQAKQHYKGRSHARRVRLLYGAPAFTAGTASDPAFSSTVSTSNDAEVSSVYSDVSNACQTSDPHSRNLCLRCCNIRAVNY